MYDLSELSGWRDWVIESLCDAMAPEVVVGQWFPHPTGWWAPASYRCDREWWWWLPATNRKKHSVARTSKHDSRI